MIHKRILMCVLAHPDDESLGAGGTVAKYAGDGVDVHLVCATRGERGRYFDNADRPPMEVVAKAREGELRAAAEALGIREVNFLDYIDGDLDKADPAEATRKIVEHLRRVKPEVVITFGPEGGYGHPDHIAICQFTTAACVAAADQTYRTEADPHQVQKLYYMQFSERKSEAYKAAFRDIRITVDGQERRSTGIPEWQLTTTIDTKAYWPQVWKAIQCHQTQLTIYTKLATLPEEHHQYLWGTQEYYRAYSLVNGGRSKERDLFEGIQDRS
jgi:LmbE family N-acetylglucosaminyl deacetylase